MAMHKQEASQDLLEGQRFFGQHVDVIEPHRIFLCQVRRDACRSMR
jgi:hypothetical protein